jgi:hypothetical protein
VTLTAVVGDDGVPRIRRRSPPPPPRPGFWTRLTGLHVRWIHYRGQGTVTFTPPETAIEAEGPSSGATATTHARFSQPGTYTLRALADDGWLFGTADVTIHVK